MIGPRGKYKVILQNHAITESVMKHQKAIQRAKVADTWAGVLLRKRNHPYTYTTQTDKETITTIDQRWYRWKEDGWTDGRGLTQKGGESRVRD